MRRMGVIWCCAPASGLQGFGHLVSSRRRSCVRSNELQVIPLEPRITGCEGATRKASSPQPQLLRFMSVVLVRRALPVLVGNSLGGYNALSTAALHPELVRSLHSLP